MIRLPNRYVLVLCFFYIAGTDLTISNETYSFMWVPNHVESVFLLSEMHFSESLTDPAGIEPAAIKLQTGALTPWTTKGLLNPYNKQTKSDDDDH